MPNIAISVRNLTKTYKLYKQPIDRLKEALHPFKKQYHKKFNALDGVSFEIKRGETVGIIGRNGSGKSTLLKIITGVLTSTSGRAIVHGRISAILELGAGFNGEMTGLENVYLNNTINGIPESETAKRVQQIVEFAELEDFIHHPIKTYSSGMKARLAFAVAINVEPDILIVDEALSVGDAAFQRKCFAKMEEIRTNGATILFVSHSEGSIVSLCSRAIWISNGAQVIDGNPKLVTGLYMKFANEKKIDKAKIKKDYASIANAINEGKSRSIKFNAVSSGEKLQNASVEEFYDPALKPKSTINYEENGAKISDVKITTLDGEMVNVLAQGREYIYCYKVQFYDQYSDIYFGMLIKSIKGDMISGGGYSLLNEMKPINVNAGRTINVSWRFNCLLNKGEYYLNAGVRNTLSGGFLHRITDAAMIKVIQRKKRIHTGFCTLITDCKTSEG